MKTVTYDETKFKLVPVEATTDFMRGVEETSRRIRADQQRLADGLQAVHMKHDEGRFTLFPKPWRAVEKDEAYYVEDANGSRIASLFWPSHPPEQTEQCERETWALAEAIAAIAAAPVAERLPEMPPMLSPGPTADEERVTKAFIEHAKKSDIPLTSDYATEQSYFDFLAGYCAAERLLHDPEKPLAVGHERGGGE